MVLKQAWSIKNYGYVGDVSHTTMIGETSTPEGEVELFDLLDS
jgi:hypothetical protein